MDYITTTTDTIIHTSYLLGKMIIEVELDRSL